MSVVFSFVTWGGPVVSGLGLYLNSSITFWVGVAIAFFNLFMNVASGAMRFPLLPLAFIVVGAVVWLVFGKLPRKATPRAYHRW